MTLKWDGQSQSMKKLVHCGPCKSGLLSRTLRVRPKPLYNCTRLERVQERGGLAWGTTTGEKSRNMKTYTSTLLVNFFSSYKYFGIDEDILVLLLPSPKLHLEFLSNRKTHRKNNPPPKKKNSSYQKHLSCDPKPWLLLFLRDYTTQLYYTC